MTRHSHFDLPSAFVLGGRPLYVLASLLFSLGLVAPAAAAYETFSLEVGGIQREYSVLTPAGAEGKQGLPALIAFHGYQSDASGLRWLTKMDSWVAGRDLVVVLPNAVNGSWNAGKGSGSKNRTTDDLAFVTQLLDVLPDRHGVDGDRISAAGFSNGAQVVALLACRRAERLAAGAMVAHTLNIEDCQPSQPVPMLIAHGAKDVLAPFGGGGPHELASHRETVDFFRSLNETVGEPVARYEEPGSRCLSYQTEQGETAVLDCVCDEAGHTWPGGVEFKTELFGLVCKEFDAGPAILDFVLGVSAGSGSAEDGPGLPPGLSHRRRPPVSGDGQ